MLVDDVAISCHMHGSKLLRYSITSPARAVVSANAEADYRRGVRPRG